MSHTHAEEMARLLHTPAPQPEAPATTAAHGEASLRSGDALLPRIQSPGDVRKLSIAELEQLAGEVRARIIEVIARVGGHFGAPLGAVDLTIALMHQYDLPKDKVVWDVGHQAYAWKILTGRNERFETIRQYNGLSGFLKRKESEYDCFGAGHASTSLSAALGIATARDLKEEDFRVAAVIGDGAMTGGMAYEALNNAGLRKTKMLMVFNDNEMSISENVWVGHKVFRKTVTHPLYTRARREIGSFIKKHSGRTFVDYAHRFEESIKNLIVPGMFFEEMGFRYIGPIDGHNMRSLVETLEHIKDLDGPICLHVITQKGKGYSFAEKDPIKYHAAADMKIETGEMKKSSGPPPFTKVFGTCLAEIANSDRSIVGITAAMDSGTGLDVFAKVHPDRYFDVGIAEENAVTMAAGMATEGMKPVCAIYSTFLQRAFDQVIHDVALQDLPVFFVLDRGGLVGADGPTHHGTFDLSYLRIIPNMVIMAPKDEAELRDMVATGVAYQAEKKGPIAVRYPRGSGLGVDTGAPARPLPIGKGEILQQGKRIALVGIGKTVRDFLEVAAILEKRLGHKVTVVNARFVKPLDTQLLLQVAKDHDYIFTVEDNAVTGGFGSAVNESLLENDSPRRAVPFGIPDRFVDHGKQTELYEELGLLPAQLASRIASHIEKASNA
ncbi:MAG: 1-deoxy-D-xylulose-5-phosphate synthase [Sumerlaeia bacterium]